MVLYHFPPLGGIAMSRNIRHVQHLPRYGWTPVVITPGSAAYEPRDPGALDLVPPDLRVIRTRSIEAGHVRPYAVRARDALRRRRARVADKPIPGTWEAQDRLAGLARLRRFLFFPDDQMYWLPFALPAALRAHRATPFDVAYSTSPPVTSHILAGLLKRLAGVPWVAEFRDPWLGSAFAARLPWLHRRLQVKLERWIVRSADRVVCVTPSLTRMYQRRYPEAPGIVTITNGYDRAETAKPPTKRSGPRRFRVVYTGTLDRPRELQVFLEGLDRLIARRPALADCLEFVFYGTVAESCRAIADRFAATGHLAGVLSFPGFVPRRAAIEALAHADAALVLLGDGPGMHVISHGKIYDYLGQNMQILAMVPPGDARDLLDGLRWGVVANPDPVDVERAIERLLSLPVPDRPADPEGRYDRATLAGRVAATLRDAVEMAPRPRRTSTGK
jgi:glycosyltransferase involved in cell wall biosynthesis